MQTRRVLVQTKPLNYGLIALVKKQRAMGRLRRDRSSSYAESTESIEEDDLTNDTTYDDSYLNKLIQQENEYLVSTDCKSLEMSEDKDDKTPRMEDLVTTLSLLGQEPIFPSLWRLDLLEMPEEYFVSCEEEHNMWLIDDENLEIPSVRMLVSSVHRDSVPHQIRGIRAFRRLIGLGSGMRARRLVQAEWGQNIRSSNGFPREMVRAFISWINKDIAVLEKDVEDYLVITTGCNRREVWYKLINDMQWQSKQTRGKIRTSSSKVLACETAIYGVGLCEQFFLLVATGIGEYKAPLKTIGILDFTDPDHDLWNAVSLAMHILTAREEAISTWYMQQ